MHENHKHPKNPDYGNITVIFWKQLRMYFALILFGQRDKMKTLWKY